MQIFPEQVAQETQVPPNSGLIKFLKDNLSAKYTITDPKVILVFDSNKGAPDDADFPWKVHVFYNSPSPLEEADLDVDVVLMNTKIKAQAEEIIRTIYPEGYIGWCGKINGVPLWIT